MMRNSWVIAAALAALLTGCESTPDATTSPTPILTPTATSASGTAASGGCPSGSAPDQPGDVAQARPALADWALLAAVDPSGPRIVVGESGFVPEGAGVATVQSMWTFDLCRNAWTEAGDASLPAPGKRPVLYQFVTSPVDGSVLGMVLGLAPLWRYDVAASGWRPVEVSGGGSDEAWPMVVYDPADNRLLAFDGNLVTADNFEVKPALKHLYAHLRESGAIRPMDRFHDEFLKIRAREVLSKIRAGDKSWRDSVPGEVADIIAARRLFGHG